MVWCEVAVVMLNPEGPRARIIHIRNCIVAALSAAAAAATLAMSVLLPHLRRRSLARATTELESTKMVSHLRMLAPINDVPSMRFR